MSLEGDHKNEGIPTKVPCLEVRRVLGFAVAVGSLVVVDRIALFGLFGGFRCKSCAPGLREKIDDNGDVLVLREALGS